MAEIKSIDINGNEIIISLKVLKEEYSIIGNKIKDLLILPSDKQALNKALTTGKIGNSNRVMLPKKFLESAGITKLKKKVKSNIFKINGDIYLLIKLQDGKIGIPRFEGDDDE